MNYFKVAITLLACAIYCDSLRTGGDGIDYNVKKHYCGELLILALETVCVDSAYTPLTEVFDKIENRKKVFKRLVNQCCIKQCNMNFIKDNCPHDPVHYRHIKSKVVMPAATNLTTTIPPTAATTPTPRT